MPNKHHHHQSSRSSLSTSVSNSNRSVQPQSSSRSSSSTSSNTKRSYTAESLLSAEAAAANQNQFQSHQSRSSSHYSQKSVSSATNRLPEFNWNVGPDSTGHFAPFPSISPSPNLFSQDFGSFDFQMFSDMSGTTKPTHTPRKDSRTNFNANQLPQQVQQPPSHQQQQHIQQDFSQQESQQHFLESNFFTVQGSLPTSVPTGIYSTQEADNYGNFSGNTMHNTSRSYGKSSRQHMQQSLPNDQIPDPGQYGTTHGQLLPNNPPPGGSSYVNFNLSTILPEFNVSGPNSDKLASLLPTTPVPPSLPSSSRTTTSTSVSTALPPLPSLTSSSATSASDFRSTSEILPPGIGIFGGHPSQMSFGSGSIPFSAASFHTGSSSSSAPNSSINFALHDQ